MTDINTSLVPSTDYEDDDVTLETFLANKRRWFGTVDSEKLPATKIRRGTGGWPSNVNKTRLAAHWLPQEAVEGNDPIAKPSRNIAAEARIFGNESPRPLSTSSPPKNSRMTPSPPHLERDGDASPLFVRPNYSQSCYRSQYKSIVHRLLPSDYESDLETTTSTNGDVLPMNAKLASADQSGIARSMTMSDALTRSDFVKTIQHNPYTSGILGYQGLSKEDSYKKIGFQNSNTRYQVRKESAPSETALGRGMQSKEESASTTKLSPEADSAWQFTSKRPRLSDLAQVVRSPRLILQMPQKAANPSALQRTLVDDDFPQTSQALNSVFSEPNPNASIISIASFVHDRAQRYGDALTKLSCDYHKDGADWRLLESYVRPDIEKFTHALLDTDHVNGQDFQKALEIWDLDAGMRALVQKYIMYSSLLKTVSSLKADIRQDSNDNM